MDRYEKAALLDFVASVIWPTRTVRLVTTPAGEGEVDVVGTWVTATDLPMAWVNGNRIAGVTWVSPTRVALGQTVALGKQVIVLVTPGSGSGYLPRNPAGVVDMLNDLMMDAHRIRELGAAVEGTDAVRLDQVQSLIQTALGGNYIAKAGDQMAGVLKLAAAATLTDAAAAVRRDMVALLSATATEAERTFLAKVFSPATVDGDSDLVLVTKGYMAQVTRLGKLPNRAQVFTTPGTWTNGWTKPAGVTEVFIFMRGGGGGGGGGKDLQGTVVQGGRGGNGGLVFARIPFSTDEAQLTFSVGGGAGGGISGVGSDVGGGGGGGGGGASWYGSVQAGGGGGGGGGNNVATGSGGAGGNNGENGYYYPSYGAGAGGVAGAGGTVQGGVGGVGGGSPGDGTAGNVTRGSLEICPFDPPSDIVVVSAYGLGGSPGIADGASGGNGTNGVVLFMWRE